MPWFHAVAERDHTILNPISSEKLELLGERLRLEPGSRVLDLACGKGGPALLLAGRFGCSVVGVERAPEFAREACRRIGEAGLQSLIEIVESDAATFPLESGAFDVVLCLGASFVWGGLEQTLATLVPTLRPGGRLAVGEPFWRSWPLPAGVDDQGWLPLRETVGRIEAAGLVLTTLIASSEDDWDTYESLRWRALEEWLASNPDDPDAAEIRARHERARCDYLSFERAWLGWAVFAARAPG